MSRKLLLSPPWGRTSDTLPSSPPLITPSLSMQLNDTSDNKQKEKEDKLPHDASVFVGSLPSNIDQGDLTRMLMHHLSEHTQIKNIKVVRDSKGGVCAFVQCEDANSATALIQTLHSSVPKPFLGRILRYEPARAFRSLLISYRTPTQFVRPLTTNTPSVTNAEIELDLPDTMRIWKHRTSRFHSILYNSEAMQAEQNCDRGLSDGPVLENILYLNPLKFDEETLHRLASYFGSLEKFSPLEVPNVDDLIHDQLPATVINSYPELHRAPRSSSMDNSCWEIKWEHRDDCVSALMTLRRVPHLTVTWAHQPASFGLTNHSNYHQSIGPPSYPFHAHHRPLAFHPFAAKKMHIVPKFQQLEEEHGDVDASADPVMVQCPTLSLERVGADRESTYRSWAEESAPSTTMTSIESSRFLNDASRGSVALSQSPWAAREYPSIGLGSEPGCGNSNEENTRETDFNDSSEAEVQELYMPPTPALDSFTITPVTPGSQFPITPTSSGADIPQNMSRKGPDAKPHNSLKGPRPDREIDPTTLFVGGLEMFGPGAWDEEKVRVFFSRFGGLESVKLVRPVNSCAAFAFVKFDNAEAPARAVFEEHNRVYEGRAMRVQLRDCNPPRNNWKFGRGRGRPHQHNFGVPRRFNYRPSFGGQERPFHMTGADKLPSQIANATSKNQLSSVADALPAGNKNLRDDIPSAPGSIDPSSSSVDNASPPRDTPPTDKYREWYDDPGSPARTPEPSSLGSSVSTAGMSFSASPYTYGMPNGPYIPPPPWMHPYSPHGPYQMPYYPGYPVYAAAAAQQPHQALTTPPGSDVGGPTTPAQHNWPMGMYTSYIPYPAIASRAQAAEQGQPPPHMISRAPVVPTGFIQNEQGTLIAVYQPDVLNQYLSGSGPPPAAMAQYSSSAQRRWDYTPPQVYEPGNIPRDTFPHTAPTPSRIKTTGFPALTPQQISAPQRGMECNAPPSPLYHRLGDGRRETQQGYFPVHRHTHPRFNNGRPTRAYAAHFHADPGYPSAQSAIPGDWNRWNNPR